MNTIKFTPEELSEIKSLQERIQEKIFEFGRFHLERRNLVKFVKEFEEREAKVEEEFNNLQNMEMSLLERLTQKYGEGQLSLSDGTFIPSSQSSTEKQ